MPNPREFGQPGPKLTLVTEETPVTIEKTTQKPQLRFNIPALTIIATIALFYLDGIGAISIPWYVALAPIVSYAIYVLAVLVIALPVLVLALVLKVKGAGK